MEATIQKIRIVRTDATNTSKTRYQLTGEGYHIDKYGEMKITITTQNNPELKIGDKIHFKFEAKDEEETEDNSTEDTNTEEE